MYIILEYIVLEKVTFLMYTANVFVHRHTGGLLDSQSHLWTPMNNKSRDPASIASSSSFRTKETRISKILVKWMVAMRTPFLTVTSSNSVTSTLVCWRMEGESFQAQDTGLAAREWDTPFTPLIQVIIWLYRCLITCITEVIIVLLMNPRKAKKTC